MKSLGRVAFTFLIGFASLDAHTQTGMLGAGVEYRTLLTKHLLLRFPAAREVDARAFAGEAEGRIAAVEDETKFQIKRPVPVFLTERRYPNAYMMGGVYGAQAHMAIPFTLELPEFSAAGFDGHAYDVFVHEFTHYVQNEMGRYGLEKIFGPLIPIDAILVPSWIWEGFAVSIESSFSPFKGRARAAYFGALLRSGLEEEKRGLEPFDFYENNLLWTSSGNANYLVGSNFMNYLAQTHGRPAQFEFIQQTAQFTFSSDFRKAFKESFRELLAAYNESLSKEAVRAHSPAQKTIWSNKASHLSALARFADGSLALVARFEDDEAWVYRLAPDGAVLARHPWVQVWNELMGPRLILPPEATASNDGHTIFFETQIPSSDGVAVDGVLAEFDLATGRSRVLAEVPTALAAAFSPEGERAWIARRATDATGALTLEIARWTRGEERIESLAQLSGFQGISSIALSPDEKHLVFSGNQGTGWDLYLFSLDQKTTKLFFASPAQELEPRFGRDGKRIYFVSDALERFDVASLPVLRDSSAKLCRETRVRWMLSNYLVPDASGVLFHDDRSGRYWNLDQSDTRAAECTPHFSWNEPAPSVLPGVANLAATVAFEESSWKSFYPVTHILWPFWQSVSGIKGLGFFLAGESPYKKLDWNLSGEARDPFRDSLAYLNVNWRDLRPWTISAQLATFEGFFDSGNAWEPRYELAQVGARYPWFKHNLGFEISSRITNGRGAASGVSIDHRFSSTVSSLLGAGPKRGFALSTQAASFPAFLGVTEPVTALRSQQRFYLPALRSRDSFALGTTELYLDQTRNVGRISGSHPLRVDSGLYGMRDPGLPGSIDSLYVRGFSRTLARGNRGLGASLDYTIPLYFLNFGTMHVADRTWFNPRFTDFEFNAFLEGARFFDKAATNESGHAATGVKLSCRVALFEFLRTDLNFFMIRRLTDDRASLLAFELGGSSAF